jgi:hypothetical protein
LVLDEKFINLLRLYQLFEDALAKPQKNPIYVSSMMSELSDVSEMLVERLQWLVQYQFPHSKFIWGALRPNSKLPDKMPMKLQRAVKRYKQERGL